MLSKKSGLKEGYKLRNIQKFYVNKILKDIEKTKKINYFISLPQGVGKTWIALSIFSELLNRNKAKYMLTITPSKNLRKHWIDETDLFFYGFKLREVKPEDDLGKIRAELKHRINVNGISMTMHTFKKFKKDLRENEFDLIVIDEASDTLLAKDFVAGFRPSYYYEGLGKWNSLKLFTFPKNVDEKKLNEMIKTFNKETSELIQEEPESFKSIDYDIKDPVLIDDPLVNEFSSVLDKKYKELRRNVLHILSKHKVGGHRENLETLLKYRTMKNVKEKYKLDKDTVTSIQTLITKYILIKHLKKWFLYCSRKILKRTILSGQEEVKNWLSREDKKLKKLNEIVKLLLKENKKIYIYSEYISTAELIYDFLLENLEIDKGEIEIVTGMVEDQYIRLKRFRNKGKILISTPVFKGGTNMPEANSAIIFTPTRNLEAMHQIKGRIRGGEIITLAYKGYEEEITNQIVDLLRD